jgi:hypothetical protein
MMTLYVSLHDLRCIDILCSTPQTANHEALLANIVSKVDYQTVYIDVSYHLQSNLHFLDPGLLSLSLSTSLLLACSSLPKNVTQFVPDGIRLGKLAI